VSLTWRKTIVATTTPTKTEYVITELNKLELWDFYPTEEAAQADLPRVLKKKEKDALEFLKNHRLYGKGGDNYWLNRYEAAKHARYTVTTYDDFLKRQRDHLLNKPLRLITEERFYEMLDVLPPLAYTRHHGVLRFCMSEFLTGPYTTQFAEYNGKHYEKIVDYYDRSTWITPAMIREAGL